MTPPRGRVSFFPFCRSPETSPSVSRTTYSRSRVDAYTRCRVRFGNVPSSQPRLLGSSEAFSVSLFVEEVSVSNFLSEFQTFSLSDAQFLSFTVSDVPRTFQASTFSLSEESLGKEEYVDIACGFRAPCSRRDTRPRRVKRHERTHERCL